MDSGTKRDVYSSLNALRLQNVQQTPFPEVIDDTQDIFDESLLLHILNSPVLLDTDSSRAQISAENLLNLFRVESGEITNHLPETNAETSQGEPEITANNNSSTFAGLVQSINNFSCDPGRNVDDPELITALQIVINRMKELGRDYFQLSSPVH